MARLSAEGTAGLGCTWANMSARAVEMLKDDIESMGPVKIKEVEGAQQQIIAVVRQLDAEGVITLKGTVGEQYVV